VSALLASAVLVATAACEPEPERKVWALDFLYYQAPDIDDHRVTVGFLVHATVCGATAHSSVGNRGGGYGHEGCIDGIKDEMAVLDQHYPYVRHREFTATAHVRIVAQYKSQVVETLYEGDVGPLAMGQRDYRGPVIWAYSDVQTSGADVPEPYAVYATITDCKLNNGSACGNNSRRYSFGKPGRSVAGLEARGASLEIPDRAGGLVREELRSGSGAERSGRPNQIASLGGVPVRRTVFGLFTLENGSSGVSFFGAELAQSLPPDGVDRTGPTVIQAAFDLAGMASGAFAPASRQMQAHDPGPLGGVVRCQTYRYTVLRQGTVYACGWADRWTVGTIVVNDRAVADLGLTEVDAAARLVAMRADIESTG
jgi:hypothetical protein